MTDVRCKRHCVHSDGGDVTPDGLQILPRCCKIYIIMGDDGCIFFEKGEEHGDV
jgi:hypothetical protein